MAERMPAQVGHTAKLVQPSIRDLRVEGLAMIFREQSRFPSGTARVSPEKAREIAEYAYQYLVSVDAIATTRMPKGVTIDG